MANLNQDQVRARLKRAFGEAGSLRKWAIEAKVSAPYASDVALGRRAPGPAICKALGLRVIRRVILSYSDD